MNSMIVRALDGGGDWTFGNGISNYNTFNQAIAQSLQTELSTFLGECFFNTSVGVDWWNLLGYKNQNAIQLQVSNIILNSFGVIGINSLNFNLNSSRNLQILYDVATIYTGNVQGSFFILTDQNGNPLVDNFGNILIGH